MHFQGDFHYNHTITIAQAHKQEISYAQAQKQETS